MDVDADSEDGCGVDHAVDADLAVVAHEEAAELQTRALKALAGIVPQLDFAIVVLEVAGGCASADVTPLADDGITEESVVRLIAVADKDGVLNFATDLAMGPSVVAP